MAERLEAQTEELNPAFKFEWSSWKMEDQKNLKELWNQKEKEAITLWSTIKKLETEKSLETDNIKKSIIETKILGYKSKLDIILEQVRSIVIIENSNKNANNNWINIISNMWWNARIEDWSYESTKSLLYANTTECIKQIWNNNLSKQFSRTKLENESIWIGWKFDYKNIVERLRDVEKNELSNNFVIYPSNKNILDMISKPLERLEQLYDNNKWPKTDLEKAYFLNILLNVKKIVEKEIVAKDKLEDKIFSKDWISNFKSKNNLNGDVSIKKRKDDFLLTTENQKLWLDEKSIMIEKNEKWEYLVKSADLNNSVEFAVSRKEGMSDVAYMESVIGIANFVNSIQIKYGEWWDWNDEDEVIYKKSTKEIIANDKIDDVFGYVIWLINGPSWLVTNFAAKKPDQYEYIADKNNPLFKYAPQLKWNQKDFADFISKILGKDLKTIVMMQQDQNKYENTV